MLSVAKYMKNSFRVNLWIKYLTFSCLISWGFYSDAALRCEFIQTPQAPSYVLFDFLSFPNKIPKDLPMGSTIYDKTVELPIWCAKKMGSFGAESVYLNRMDLTDVLGKDSGLTVFVTLNGKRGDKYEMIDTGYSTNIPYVQGLPVENYLNFKTSVRIELVKTGPNNIIEAKGGFYQILFSVGSQSDGSLSFLMNNANNLQFTMQTCDISGDKNIQIALPDLNINELRTVGPIEGHSKDFTINLNCSADIWSTMNIMMSLAGTSAGGTGTNGVFEFRNSTSGDAISGLGVQMLRQLSSSAYEEITNGAWFKIGQFGEGQTLISVPFRARYYRTTNAKVEAGMVKSLVTYTVNYQ
ncbi:MULTISPECIES: fimbrial protein [unclassified Serratia (in: enterobacteria)]|uniref:fimbrial protein n=1 Tax=unclassified Serratia (in: enterobacteria) TaxID=2647522 RepID=UPI002ED14F8A|nr:fimbrial protein [Serratia sp. C2(2)]MEE4449348.1 fimbrial protein [Serratia sp. C2(1)]